ncbi:prostatic spermine-binding protein [Prunus yedoensis var. nudiflora]|uniref:Prostatic spermine-binding protein n=1 Tax=Prunus yedoensis var. nudiflora TaxID=2094558 RepID=A0A314UX81_PRUYE|nr:prostatic spermine-binding protein [Prunus yedoensis var. nudiflora]
MSICIILGLCARRRVRTNGDEKEWWWWRGCGWPGLVANVRLGGFATLLTSALLSLAAQDPFALSTACGQKSGGDNESEHSNYKAVDADEDGDEERTTMVD